MSNYNFAWSTLKLNLPFKMLLMAVLITGFTQVLCAGENGTRAIFDEGIYWAKSPLKVNETLDRIAKAGFNTYIPCIWHGQGAMWDSKIVDHWYKNPELSKRDPLKNFIKLAHKKNIKVYPCFTVMARQHDFYEQYTTAARKNMFNVHDEEFRGFIKDVILEVVKNYDIDGVNLDYVRAGQVCYEESCRKSYQQFNGHSLMADLAIRKVDPKAINRIVEWQRSAMKKLMRSIADDIRKIKPNIEITVSAAPWADTVLIEGQDSIGWANEGIVDAIYSMNYQKNIPWERLQQERAKLNNAGKLVIMVSNYRKKEPNKKTRGKADLQSMPGKELYQLTQDAMRFNGGPNYAVYIYSMMSDEQVDYLNKYSQF